MRLRKLFAPFVLVIALGAAFPTTASAHVPTVASITRIQEVSSSLLSRLLSWLERTSSQLLTGIETKEGASMTSNG